MKTISKFCEMKIKYVSLLCFLILGLLFLILYYALLPQDVPDLSSGAKDSFLKKKASLGHVVFEKFTIPVLFLLNYLA